MYTFAKPRHVSEVAALMPKPVTIYDSVVRLKADMSDPNISEMQIPPHFTNIQHGLQLARKFLSAQDTPNRQVMLITDGLPTAHFEGERLFLLYPPDPRTENATLREAQLCAAKGSRSTSSCCRAGTRRRRTCSSPTAWRSPRRAASSSRPAATWTATSSGTTLPGGSRLFRKKISRKDAKARKTAKDPLPVFFAPWRLCVRFFEKG